MDSREEFPEWSIERLQVQFFLGQLPSAPDAGRYRFRARSLDAPSGTVVLFQFDRRVVASAVLAWIERYAQPDGLYGGAMWFEPKSIRIFEPMAAEEIQRVWPETFSGFTNAMWQLDPPDRYYGFERLQRKIAAPLT